jgi:hypothetical protein
MATERAKEKEEKRKRKLEEGAALHVEHLNKALAQRKLCAFFLAGKCQPLCISKCGKRHPEPARLLEEAALIECASVKDPTWRCPGTERCIFKHPETSATSAVGDDPEGPAAMDADGA